MRTTGTYRAALHAARAAARLAPELNPRVAATVRENLRLAFGRADGALLRAVYRHFAEAAVDLLFFPRLFRSGRIDDHFTLRATKKKAAAGRVPVTATTPSHARKRSTRT